MDPVNEHLTIKSEPQSKRSIVHTVDINESMSSLLRTSRQPKIAKGEDRNVKLLRDGK